MKNLMLYFDHAATTYMIPEVLEVYEKFAVDVFGNPSSSHIVGMKPKRSIDEAKEIVSGILNCDSEDLIFTSGGTESNNLVLKGIAEKNNFKGHIVTTAIEHHSVLHTCQYLEQRGLEVTYLEVDKDGKVDLASVKNALRDDTILVSIMYANNEIGTIQPISDISNLLKEKNIPFHTDAVQAGGALDCDVEKLGVDFLSLSAHKFYGPKGIGVLFIKDKSLIVTQIHGGAQQYGMRAGTYNVSGIMAFSEALRIAYKNLEKENERLISLRQFFLDIIMTRIPGIILSGHPDDRLPNNIHICFKNIDSNSLLLRLSNNGISVATGSACTSGNSESSHVIKALGLDECFQKGALRITLGKRNTKKDVEKLIDLLEQEILEMNSL